MHLTDLLTGPPGGWKFQEERTGHWMAAVTFSDLIGKVARHRNNMKYAVVSPPHESLAAEIEDWICAHLQPRDRERNCKGEERAAVFLPGNLFSHLIHQVTGKYAQTCGVCLGRIKQMNEWGWIECWKRRDEICGWLKQEAANRGHAISDSDALTFFRAGWRELVLGKHKIAGLPTEAE